MYLIVQQPLDIFMNFAIDVKVVWYGNFFVLQEYGIPMWTKRGKNIHTEKVYDKKKKKVVAKRKITRVKGHMQKKKKKKERDSTPSFLTSGTEDPLIEWLQTIPGFVQQLEYHRRTDELATAN